MDEIARHLRIALEMYEVGEQMQRARLRRTNPTASPAEIEDELRTWLRTRPGAEHGDFPGPLSRRFG